MDKHMGETSTTLAAIHMPMFEIVQMDVSVQRAFHLVVWVESVGQNVAAIFAWTIELLEGIRKGIDSSKARQTMCESPWSPSAQRMVMSASASFGASSKTSDKLCKDFYSFFHLSFLPPTKNLHGSNFHLG